MSLIMKSVIFYAEKSRIKKTRIKWMNSDVEFEYIKNIFRKWQWKFQFIMKKLDEMLENVTCFLKKWDVFMKSVKVYAEKSKLKSKKSDEM